MTSLRGRLFLLLILATGVLWLSATAWIYVSSRAELERVLDTRLREAARMVHSLVSADNAAVGRGPVSLPAMPAPGASYERQLSCQVWSLDGHLVTQSGGAPKSRLSEVESGFSDRRVDGELWRVYTLEDRDKGVRVMVGDRVGLRDRLVWDLIVGLMAPALLIVPLLGLLIWISLGQGLRPLMALTAQIAARGPDDMRRVDVSNAPAEVRPLADALNGLFAKVEVARRHERDLTAFAAHELKTPLAGLKTQAQVALATKDDGVRESALRQMLVSVDRASRLVRQLLTLARLEAGGAAPADETAPVNVGRMLDELVEEARAGGSVSIDPALREMEVRGDAEALRAALRNLLENARQYSPAGGAIAWRRLPGAALCVEDEGPGIAEKELPFVTQRFYRGESGRVPGGGPGTGLGLAIVEAALRHLGAGLTLANRTERRGLRATVTFGG